MNIVSFNRKVRLEMAEKLTAYYSIMLIMAELFQLGTSIINKDKLIEELYKIRNDERFKDFFEFIVFRDNAGSVVSEDIDTALVNLVRTGFLSYVEDKYITNWQKGQEVFRDFDKKKELRELAKSLKL